MWLTPVEDRGSFWCQEGVLFEWENYQRLCYAVIGFTLGFLTQLRTGVSVWGQLNAFPFAYLWAYGLVVIGSLLNQ